MGLWLTAHSAGRLIWIGLAGLLIAWAYSAPPLQLMARGVGEGAIAAGWLMVVLGTDFVQRGEFAAPLDDSTCITLFRLVQEGLTNVVRHAGADQVRIDLHPGADGQCFTLIIEDNGCGMAPSDGRHGGFGLIGMRERVAGLQGQIRLISAPGRGLRIEVQLPAGRFAS